MDLLKTRTLTTNPWGTLAVWVAVLVLIPVAAQACPVCVGPSSGDPTAPGFYWGILFLMTMPFVVVGSIALWLAYVNRRAYGRKKVPIEDLRG